MQRMNAATEAALGRPGPPPLAMLLRPALDLVEERHHRLLAEAGFADLRRAHNAVLANLAGDGMRLTELAAAGSMTKQAMGELVDDLVAKGYLERRPDPADGRAKLICWAERGLAAHDATLAAFATIERELTTVHGRDALERLRDLLLAVVTQAPPSDG